MGQVAIHTTPWNSTCRGASSWRAFTKTCGSVTCARNWRFVLNAQTGKTALHTTRSRSACCAVSSWRDAVAKCPQARPVGTTPIVAWHEVPGKRPSKEPSRRVRYDRAQLIPEVFLVEMCAVFLKEGLNTLLVSFVSDEVRAAARCNGPFPEPARYQR